MFGPSQEELFNANLERMGHDDGADDDDDDLNLDIDDDEQHGHGHEQIELMERGTLSPR